MIAQRIEWFTLQEIVIANALPNPIPAFTGLYLSDIVELPFIMRTSPKGGANPTGIRAAGFKRNRRCGLESRE